MAALEFILTCDHLKEFGVLLAKLVFPRSKWREDVNHLLTHCRQASQFWNHFPPVRFIRCHVSKYWYEVPSEWTIYSCLGGKQKLIIGYLSLLISRKKLKGSYWKTWYYWIKARCCVCCSALFVFSRHVFGQFFIPHLWPWASACYSFLFLVKFICCGLWKKKN